MRSAHPKLGGVEGRSPQEKFSEPEGRPLRIRKSLAVSKRYGRTADWLGVGWRVVSTQAMGSMHGFDALGSMPRTHCLQAESAGMVGADKPLEPKKWVLRTCHPSELH